MHRFLRDESALEVVEYAIIAGLIVSGLVVLIVSIGGWVKVQFTNLQNSTIGAGGGRGRG